MRDPGVCILAALDYVVRAAGPGRDYLDDKEDLVGSKQAAFAINPVELLSGDDDEVWTTRRPG